MNPFLRLCVASPTDSQLDYLEQNLFPLKHLEQCHQMKTYFESNVAFELLIVTINTIYITDKNKIMLKISKTEINL